MSAPAPIRLARRDDLPAIVKLLLDDPLGGAREDPREPPAACYVTAFAALEADANNELAVMEREGAVIGCLQITFIPGLSRKGAWRAQIESVRIASARRGEGLGRQFFEWAIARAKDKDCGLVQLTTDKARPEALRFYESLGFTASHEGMKLAL